MKKKEKIKENNFYTPLEVTDFLETNASNKNVAHQMVLRHIRNGKLKSVNTGRGNKPRYVIQGKDILKYKTTHFNSKFYSKK